MNHSNPAVDDDVVADGLAKRLFVMTMIGVVVYMGAILALMSTAG
jgi:hypothetical protein